jgi:Hg(II)-responsive transcriptional regulator
MRIGEVAQRADVNVQTLRYYERRGLLPAPRRRPSGYREYPADTVRLVRFIKRAQELGFSLSDIAELIALRRDPAQNCASVCAAAARKAADVADRIRQLTAVHSVLEQLTQACESAAGNGCPVIEALEDDGPDHGTPAGQTTILS